MHYNVQKVVFIVTYNIRMAIWHQVRAHITQMMEWLLGVIVN
jgi:hypothetical protein